MAQKNVKLGRLNGEVKDYRVTSKATIEDVMAIAEESLAKGETLTIDEETVRKSYVPDDGDEVIIVPSTTGA